MNTCTLLAEVCEPWGNIGQKPVDFSQRETGPWINTTKFQIILQILNIKGINSSFERATGRPR